MTSERGHVQIGECRLAYRIDGDGPALLLVHAGIADGRMWNPQIGAFAEHYRVIRPDLRGYGETVRPDEPHANHADLQALLEHLDAEQAAVVGASMGGAAALDLCLEYPELVERLVLVCSALGGHESEDPWLAQKWKEAEDAYEGGDPAAAARIEMETWLAGPQRSLGDLSPDVVDRLRRMLLRSYELDVEVEELELSPPASARLAEIAAPTLVLSGAGDVTGMQRTADRIAEGIRDAEKRVLDDCAHLPNMECPADFNRVVLDFLGRS